MYFAPLAPENHLLRPYAAPKNPKTPKNAINLFGSQCILEASGRARRSNTAPRRIRATPTVGAPSGACGRSTYTVVHSIDTSVRLVFKSDDQEAELTVAVD
jgi:hypothetical protein